MPFKSEAQRAWMHANKPKMAKRWEKHTPKGKKLPKRAKKKPKSESLLKRIDNVLTGEPSPKVSINRIGFESSLEHALDKINDNEISTTERS